MADNVISLYRARLSAEQGTVRKDWGGRLSVALVYPNFYHLGMSNLGFQIVYHLLNKRSDVVAERSFLPEGQEMSLYLQSGRPLLSLESQSPLNKFDLVAFSLSFENDYPNILKILELSKIPLFSEERTGAFPFVMAGGITTFLNPEPLASFFDFFLLGEAEVTLNEFIEQFIELKTGHAAKPEILKALALNIPSLYVPFFYHPEYYDDGTLKSFSPRESWANEKIQVPLSCTIESEEVPFSRVTTSQTEFSDKPLIELSRGCGHSCRFCAAGYVYRPPRAYRHSDLKGCIEKALEKYDQVGLLSAAVSDVPGIEEFTSGIIRSGGRFSVSSLRTDALKQGLVENLKQAGQKTLSIAPEAGSERLRRVINKHLTRDRIIDAVRLISKTGEFTIRLYFLIGLPTESQKDMSEIIDLVKVIKQHMIKESAERGRIGQIKLSVNCFVPKPFTPFQWFAMEQIPSLKEKQKWLRKTLAKDGGIKVNFDVPRWAYVQTLLSLGDRRVGSILLMSHKFGGDWKKALRFSNVDPDFFVYRPRKPDETLPWDFIDHGIRKKHLLEEYNLALKGEESDICSIGDCRRCGVCGRESRGDPIS